MSYFAFIRIFLLWICVYFVFNKKETNLDKFTNHLTRLQTHYSEGNRYLQNFMLSGYHQPSFYITGKQKDLDLFDMEQETILSNLDDIKREASENHIKINDRLDALSSLHKSFADTVKLLRQIYLNKGFKDFGAEGTMRRYAHFLEDSTPIDKVDILMLRRREKDFLLRDEQKYIEKFNTIADYQAIKFSNSPSTLTAITNYQKSFNEFAACTERLSLNTNHGLYGHLQTIINQLDSSYVSTNNRAVNEISHLNNVFKTILIISFIVLLVAAVYLSLALSHKLTRDITNINKSIAELVESDFNDEYNQPEPMTSRYTEIQELNNDIIALRHALKIKLAELKNATEYEKQKSAVLAAAITKLEEQIAAITNKKL